MQAVRRSAGCQRNDTMHRYYRARDPGNCCCCVPRMPEIPFRLPTPRLFSFLDPLGVKNSFMIYMNGCSVFKCIQTYSCLFPRVKFESDNYQNPALCVKRARDRARERDRLRGARESARLHVLLGTVLTEASLFSHLLIVNKLLSLSLSLSFSTMLKHVRCSRLYTNALLHFLIVNKTSLSLSFKSLAFYIVTLTVRTVYLVY